MITKSDKAFWAAILIGPLAIAFCIWFQASMESHTYNKLTGANTTWWDALWVELRVQDKTEK
jgi:hypothetical protein